jgi:Flp pilus assembly protein TadB
VIVGVLGLSLSPIRHIRRIYFEKRMHESLLGLLDEVILSMRSGHSLRITLEIVGNRHPGLIGHIFIEIARRLEHGSGSDGLHGISLELMTEFARAHQSNVKIIDQICLYRRTCRIKSNFRRKSGQVTAQTRMQSVLTCVLYAPLLGFYIFSVQQPFSSRLFLSVGLFSVAQVWIHFGSRRVKWCI